MGVIEDIVASAEPWGGWGHQNSQLELASMALEARLSVDIEPLRVLYDRQLVATRIGPGLFKRSPRSTMANSHDNVAIGLACLSETFDGGRTAAEILDQGPLYMSGKNEHGKWLDAEWFMLLNPANRALLKLACGRKLSWLEDFMLRKSLVYSTVWNTKRVKLLFLYKLGYQNEDVRRAALELGTKYRGRYGNNPIYLELWRLNRGCYL